MFALWTKYLGDQWSIGDWDGMVAAAPDRAAGVDRRSSRPMAGDEPPQNLKEYDPEWARAFWSGTVAAQLRPRADARRRQGPRAADPPLPAGRRSDGRAHGRAVRPPGRAGASSWSPRPGSRSSYRSFPTMGHSMHGQDPRCSRPPWPSGPTRSADRRGWVSVVVTPSRPSEVGTLTVRRALPNRGRRTVGAWCFADHMGPVEVDRGAGRRHRPAPAHRTADRDVARRGRDRPSRQPRLGAADPGRPAQPHDGRARRLPLGGAGPGATGAPCTGSSSGSRSRRPPVTATRPSSTMPSCPSRRWTGHGHRARRRAGRRRLAGPAGLGPRRRRARVAARALDPALARRLGVRRSWSCRGR